MKIYVMTNNYFFYLGFSKLVKGLAKVKFLHGINDREIISDGMVFISSDIMDSSPGVIIDVLKMVNGKISNIFIDNVHPCYSKCNLIFKAYDSKGTLRSIKSLILKLHKERTTFTYYVNLSSRETEVLFLLKSGMRGVDISRKWSCSPKTVYTHKCNALKKLRVSRFSCLVSPMSFSEDDCTI